MHGVLAYEDHRRYFARFRCQSADLNGLLDLAERIRHNCVRKSSSLETLRLIRTGLFGMLILIVGGSGLALPRLSPTATSPACQFLMVGCAVVVLALTANLLWRHQRHWSWQRRWHANEVAALQHVLAILEDCEEKVADDQHWSPIDRARFRVQLARYDLGKRQRPSGRPPAAAPAADHDPSWPAANLQDPLFDPVHPRVDRGHGERARGRGAGLDPQPPFEPSNPGIFTPMRTGRIVLRR